MTNAIYKPCARSKIASVVASTTTGVAVPVAMKLAANASDAVAILTAMGAAEAVALIAYTASRAIETGGNVNPLHRALLAPEKARGLAHEIGFISGATAISTLGTTILTLSGGAILHAAYPGNHSVSQRSLAERGIHSFGWGLAQASSADSGAGVQISSKGVGLLIAIAAVGLVSYSLLFGLGYVGGYSATRMAQKRSAQPLPEDQNLELAAYVQQNPPEGQPMEFPPGPENYETAYAQPPMQAFEYNQFQPQGMEPAYFPMQPQEFAPNAPQQGMYQHDFDTNW